MKKRKVLLKEKIKRRRNDFFIFLNLEIIKSHKRVVEVEKKEYNSFKERILDIPNVIKKHPIETILTSFSIGFIIYILIWRN